MNKNIMNISTTSWQQLQLQPQPQQRPANVKVNNAWALRTSNTKGPGRRSFVPQVGDSIMYIPRAHVCSILAEEASGRPLYEHVPWNCFPKILSSDPSVKLYWSVVRCRVLSIDYHFPKYFHGDVCSIVAKLRLEVTGVPPCDEDPMSVDGRLRYPCLKSHFVPPDSDTGGLMGLPSLEFELQFIQNDQPEFLIPEALYLWRIKCLANAIEQNGGVAEGLDLIAFFAEDDGTKQEPDLDPIYEPSRYKISKIKEVGDVLQSVGRFTSQHLLNTGFESIVATSTSYSGFLLKICPWEVEILPGDVPPSLVSSTLSHDNSLKITDLIRETLSTTQGSIFSFEKCSEFYASCSNKVEIEIDLDIISKRLEGGYYRSEKSVLADLSLLKSNFLKCDESKSNFESATLLYDKIQAIIRGEANSSLKNKSFLEKRMEFEKNSKSQSRLWSTLLENNGPCKGVSQIEQGIVSCINIGNDFSFDAFMLCAMAVLCITLSDRALIFEVLDRGLKNNRIGDVSDFLEIGGLKIIAQWLDDATPRVNKENGDVEEPSQTVPLLLRILSFLQCMPFKIELIIETQINKKIKKVKKIVSALDKKSSAKQLLGLNPSDLQKSVEHLMKTWTKKGGEQESISSDEAFESLMEEMNKQLASIAEHEREGRVPPWIEKMKPKKRKVVPLSKDSISKQIEARKRSEELKEGQAFLSQAKRAKLQTQIALGEELANEYIKKRDAWKMERERSKVKLLEQDRKGHIPTVKTAPKIRWSSNLVSYHYYDADKEFSDSNENDDETSC